VRKVGDALPAETREDERAVSRAAGARSVMKKPRLLIGTVLFSGQGALSSPC